MSQLVKLFEDAYKFFTEGKFSDAINTLDSIDERKEDEEHISLEDVFILKGSSYLALNDIVNSKYEFEKALRLNPQSTEACMGLGKVLYSSGEKKESKIMFEWAVKNDEENEAALETLRNINALLGYPEDHFTEDSEFFDSENDLIYNDLFNEAYELMLNSSFDESLESILELERIFLEDVSVLKGNVYLAKDEFDEAKECFEMALKANANCVAAFNGLAELYASKNMLDDAKAMYEFALSIDPEDQFAGMGLAEINYELGLPTIHSTVTFLIKGKLTSELDEKLNIAYKLFQDKKYEDSLKMLKEVEGDAKIAKEINYKEIIPSISNFTGFNYLGLGDLEKAKTCFETSLQENPHSSQACAGLGEIMFLQDMEKEAKLMFEWAVKNNPNNYYAVIGLAKINEALGYNQDHSSLNHGLPNEVEFEFSQLLTTAYSLFENQKFGEALSKVEDAEDLLIKNSDETKIQKALTSLYNLRGFTYLSMNNLAKAREAYEKALRLNSQSSQACAGLGEVFYLTNKDVEAKKMFEYAVNYEPLNQFAAAGLKKANESLGLPENDNSLMPKPKKEKSAAIEKLIQDAYESFNDKNYNSVIEKLKEAEDLLTDNFSSNETTESLTRINNFKGFSYMSLHNLNEAKECFQRALHYNANSSQACAGLGNVLLSEGKKEEAKTMYEWAVKNNPDNSYAKVGLSNVNKMLGFDEENNSLLKSD